MNVISCPTCGKENSTESGGNAWFCAIHYAEAIAKVDADNAARAAEHKARRVAGSRKAQETKRAIADGTYRAPRKDMESYRRIKENYCNRMGW